MQRSRASALVRVRRRRRRCHTFMDGVIVFISQCVDSVIRQRFHRLAASDIH